MTLQGRLAVFTSPLAGPGVVEALTATEFGRRCMRYINHLYVERGGPELVRVAGVAGVSLLLIGSDIDFDSQVSVGVALAAEPLPGALSERDDPGLAGRLGVTDVAVGDALLTAWWKEPLPAPDPEGLWLRTWAERSAEAAQQLRRETGRPRATTFLVPAGERALAGILLRQ